ncbi:putative sporulation protein YtxC [Alkalihalobacillus alcalophilus]|uniref:putative sporulation protein YtxC n=1 Tax=Alkalihalobacillus alcalophilus TaxID=1445 RepID=UPI00030914AE|nr:putative sporulation protein YtxC [Alkalihalobacillus alcalophilus]MED1563888.1 putative sporulation protein YtxC [Alkalihalobacillus alcalophilus]
MLIAIHFEEEQHCQQLFQQLREYFKKFSHVGLEASVALDGNETIHLHYHNKYVSFYDSFHPFVTSVLTDYVIRSKEEEWILDIIESVFFFHDEEEQQQILAIAKSILEGDRDDLPALLPFFDRHEHIYQAFANSLDEETTFYYEPFLTFRLKSYGEMLIDCVEMAIDEYMLEQEYQNMIESFRQFIQNEQAKYELIYVVHDNQKFTFYDSTFRKVTQEEILFYLEVDLIFEQGLNVEEMVISPLVSLVPKKVKVFSDHSDDGVILSLQAIFQERLQVYRLFDFMNEKNI